MYGLAVMQTIPNFKIIKNTDNIGSLAKVPFYTILSIEWNPPNLGSEPILSFICFGNMAAEIDIR